MHPLLKWAGGKRQMAPRIAEAFGSPCHDGRIYVEPFVGSGAVFLYRRALGHVWDAILGDANGKLIAFHRAVRDDPKGLLDALHALPGQTDWRDAYTEVRVAFNAGPHEGSLHAARFLWLNRACFNGLYRENAAGEFNVPIGSYKALSLPSAPHVLEVSLFLQPATLICADFAATLAWADAGAQVYCDPPYVPLTPTANFTSYTADGFGAADQERLASAARETAARGARVVISNHDTPLTRETLYAPAAGFTHELFEARRSISHDGNRTPARELLATIGPA